MRKKLRFLLFLSLFALSGAIIFAIFAKCQPVVDRNGQCPFPTTKYSERNPVGFSPSFSPSPVIRYPSSDAPLSVVRLVHDGDTIYTREFKTGVRLIGIDAPELAGSYRCGVDAKCDAVTEECGASDAKNKLMELVLNHEVALVEDEMTGQTDKYGRELRYVYFCRGTPWRAPTDCLDISLEMIRLGFAREASFGNAYLRQKIYQEAENEAKIKKLGIWGECE